MSPATSESTGFEREPGGLRCYLFAAALGAAALVLDSWSVPLLTPETPVFILGGGLVLLAYAVLGEGPGLLAGVLSVSLVVAGGRGVDLVTLLYVVQQWVAYRVYRRWGSFIVGVGVFWLGVGWLADLVLYRYALGLSGDYVLLIYIKQLFNGVLDALIAEALLRALPRSLRGKARAVQRLRHFVVGSVLFAVMVPLLVVALVYTREVYQRHIYEVSQEARETARAISAAVEQPLQSVVGDLRRVARAVEILRARGEQVPPERLDAFLEAHTAVHLLCLTDAEGRITASSPAADLRGRPIVGLRVGGSAFFREARSTLQTAFAPLSRGRLHMRRAVSEGPLLVVAEHLLDAAGGFSGIAYAATSADAFRDVLESARPSPPTTVTLVDREGVVIASLDPRFAVGERLEDLLGAAGLSASDRFAYYPPDDGTRESRLRLNLRHADVEPVGSAGWRVLVDRPASVLHARMRPSAWQLIGGFAATPLLIALVVLRFSRQVADPLEGFARATRGVVNDPPSPVEVPGLTGSPIAELRDLGRDLRITRDALAARDLEQVRRLESSERRYRSVVENVGTLLLILDRGGRILEFNRAAESVFGIAREAALGRDYVSSFAPESAHEDVRRDLDQVLREGSTSRYEGPVATSSGARRVVVWTLTRFGGGTDDGAGVVASGEDVTEARELQEQLFQSQKLESVGRLAGGVAHDFNNLLTALLASVDMAELELPAGHPVLRELDTIRSVSERASSLTRQLLGFARRQTRAPQTLDLNRLVREGQSMLRRVIGEHVEVATRLEPGLWPVRADPSQLEQVLVNLAINARDAMPRGGELWIGTDNVTLDDAEAQRLDLAPGDYVRWKMADTGEGVPEALRSHVFEPFFTTKEQGKGTGLGLATCYGIVAQNGGRIELARSDVGAEFHVYLPRAETSDGPGSDSSGEWPVMQGHETILLAEDDAAVRRSLVRALERRGYRVLAAEGGEQALALAEGHAGPIDLLLSDVVMPRISGPELAARLGELRPGLRVLFMSGHAAGLLDAGPTPPGGFEFLPKPFTGEKLARRVRAILDGAGRPSGGEGGGSG